MLRLQPAAWPYIGECRQRVLAGCIDYQCLLLDAFSVMPDVPNRFRSTLSTSATSTPCKHAGLSHKNPTLRAKAIP